MKILAIGDTHGNTSAICNVAIPQARKNDCKTIVQCGDFGYWEHQQEGARFLNKVSKCLVREDMTMLWIDGNHENHPLLWDTYAPSGPYGFCMIRPNLYYIPRGTVFKLGETTCLALGGAFSIDKNWRINAELEHDKPGTLWWPTEMTRFEDAQKAITNASLNGPIDIMFTHDCPEGTSIPGIHSVDKWRFPETWQNRELLREVFDVAQPRLLVHGHYHVRYTAKLPLKPKVGTGDLLEWEYCRVDGLANDGLDGFAVVLDLDSLFMAE